MASKRANVITALDFVRSQWREVTQANRLPNWLGVGLGRTLVNGAEQNCITFFVRKAPEPRLAPILNLPQLKGIPTEVIQVGRWKPLAGDELQVGGSVFSIFGGRLKSPSGSAGILLKKSDGTVWLLSANHVISLNNRSSPKVFLDVPGTDELLLGDEVKDVQIQLTGNHVDVAAGRLKVDSSTFADFYKPVKNDLKDPTPVNAKAYADAVATTSRTVIKVGAATQRRFGTAKYVNTSLTVDLSQLGFESAIFEDVLVVADQDSTLIFGDKGDSGSLVIDEEFGKPVGILFGRSTNAPFLCLVGYLEIAFEQFKTECQCDFSVFTP